MALHLTGKEKAARVPLGYYRFLGTSRKALAWILVMALVVAAAAAFALGKWKQAASPGPVHSAHARWENDCSSCHTPFTPTAGSNGFGALFLSKSKPSDALCQQCHMGHSGQEHHATQIATEVESCASCHKDHRGRSAFISRVADAKCTNCHNDLKSHTKDKATDYANTVTLFERDHPQFRIGKGKDRLPLTADSDSKKATDPGNLRFNHKLHLAAGLDVGWTFEKIPEAGGLRDRYLKMQEKLTGQKATAQTEMKLDCASCHALAGADDPGRKGAMRETGDYVMPVTYEQHCKACHPLTFSSDAGLKNVEIPHHLQPPQVREFLAGAFARTLVKGGSKAKQKPDSPLPGRDPDEEPKARAQLKSDAEKGSRYVFEEQAEKAARYVFPGKSTCQVCHFYAGGKGPAEPERILPVNVPEVWYQHAKFSHQAHRTVDCRGCHTAADESTTEKDVLLPGVKNCVECHASAKTVEGDKKGGVRQDCVTCHSYHHGDSPLAGRGAEARGVEKRVDLKGWLNGKFGEKK